MSDASSQSFPCSVCGSPLGEHSALHGLEYYGKVICGDCVQKADPEYQKWKNEQAGVV